LVKLLHLTVLPSIVAKRVRARRVMGVGHVSSQVTRHSL
jgi:hypothetical protein